MTTKISGDNISSIANTGVNWNAVTVADGSTQLNASAGNGYFLDTNTGVIEVFLPSSPTRGDTIVLADYSGTFGTNKVIINTGGVLIDSTVGGGSGTEYELSTNNTVAELVYVDTSKGWLIRENGAPTSISGAAYIPPQFTEATGGTITTSGDFKIHTFTGDGCFTTTTVGTGPLVSGPSAGPNIIEYLVVAGGGGGGYDNAGGGGAGGFRVSSGTTAGCYTASPLGACVPGVSLAINSCGSNYPITVGGGGAAPPGNRGAPGSNSIFSTITSTGGGGQEASPSNTGSPGGSGGGGYGRACGCGGIGNTPPVSPPQGNNGGNGTAPPQQGGGGGGGAGAAGSNANADDGGPGGIGLQVGISGSDTYYGGGGGGGSGTPSGAGGQGGCGGGGNGGAMCSAGGAAGPNTGGGGGGGGNQGGLGTAGGKGIVILRYKFQ